MGAGRPASGPAGGALSGGYPTPGVGAVATRSVAITEEWLRGVLSATNVGDCGFQAVTIAGTPVWTHVTPTADTEVGIMSVATSNNLNDAGALSYLGGANCPFFRYPPPGSVWATKLKNVTDGLNRTVWSGFISAATAVPLGAGNDFIGVRCDTAGAAANWFGIVKAGAAETTVDLGVLADTTWRIVGFQHVYSFLSGTLGIQFYTYDCRNIWDSTVVPVGGPVTTNLPTNPLTPVALGIQTKSGVIRSAQSDFFTLGGVLAR